MAFSKSLNPKRKRRVHAVRDSPFPVSIATDQQDTSWFYYTGYLHDDHIEIKHSGDIERLYKMGFFGKGTLSRSKPEFNQRFKSVDVPNSTGEIIHARVISRRSYVHRLNWCLQQEGKPVQHIEYDSSEDLWDAEETERSNAEPNKTEIEVNIKETSNTEVINQNVKPLVFKDPWELSKNWLETSNTGSKVELWEEDADFWNTDSLSESTGKSKRSEVWQESESFWTGHETEVFDPSDRKCSDCLGVAQRSDKMSSESSELSSMTSEVDIVKDTTITNVENLTFPRDLKNFNKSNGISLNKEINLPQDSHTACQKKGNTVQNITTRCQDLTSSSPLDIDISSCNNSSSESNFHNTVSIQNKPNDDEIMLEPNSGIQHIDKSLGKDQDNDTSINTLSHEKGADLQIKAIDKNSLEVASGSGFHGDSSESDLDPLCMSDHDDGNLFVVDDTDSEAEYTKRKKITRKKWRPVLKRDPFFVKENLHLSFEEAFFLSFGLGCLMVQDENSKKPGLTEMWQLFIGKQKTFIPNYIAYHYYRSKGWVPKTGLKFGTDFLIYKEGPAFYHGSYSVIVKMVHEDTLDEDQMYNTRDLTWTSLAGLNRLTEQVAKEVLMCYVIRPSTLSDEDLQSPKCIPHFKVKEVLLSRWISSQEREKQVEDIP